MSLRQIRDERKKSREICDKFPGALLPSRCLKRQQKDKMLGEDGLMWEISHVNDMGVLNSSWKEEKSSNGFQEVQNGVDYVDPPEELWSKNLDSAASVFPPSTLTPTLDFDIWGEIYGDLISWCPEPLQDTSCTMVGDRKGSNCIVQDDELNTPETGVEPEFDFTSLLGVMETSSAVKEGTDKISNTPVILNLYLSKMNHLTWFPTFLTTWCQVPHCLPVWSVLLRHLALNGMMQILNWKIFYCQKKPVDIQKNGNIHQHHAAGHRRENCQLL
ncbi:uncharacterized protein LOC111871631 isoform X3 [Cryptotermes secundus]|uniref:uncharacterized protein LOC111871631 isoform X3 n=1 Tax=Cryptotermes secundus TaxID=105785 RepID=UPI000CD7AB24|nr:uncharacterized protein LOC111871631 isoform X3 [Cryptotermes secundus]